MISSILVLLKLKILKIKRIIQWMTWKICKMVILTNIMMIRMSLINSLFIKIILFNKIIFPWINFKKYRSNIWISIFRSNLINRIIISQLILSTIIKNKTFRIKIWKMKQFLGFKKNCKNNWILKIRMLNNQISNQTKINSTRLPSIKVRKVMGFIQNHKTHAQFKFLFPRMKVNKLLSLTKDAISWKHIAKI